MNTSITSNSETANSLLNQLSDSAYDNLDISNVSEVIGTSAEIANIRDSGNFVGFSTTKTLIVD